MLKTVFAFAAVASTIATASFAGTSAGEAQRAAILGVPAGQYTAAELSLLESARRDNDPQAWNFVISGDVRAEGKGQLAGAYAYEATGSDK